MAHYARLIARDLQQSHGLSDEFIEHLYLFAPLHDIGKIGIPDSVLLKPGHHECLDGTGYPLGLKGEAISIEARIIAVADVLDALISGRPYKQPWTIEAAIDELDRLVASGKFDAD